MEWLLDRLYINNNDRHPFCEAYLNRTINIVSEAIIREFNTQNTGMAQLAPKMLEKLNKNASE